MSIFRLDRICCNIMQILFIQNVKEIVPRYSGGTWGSVGVQHM